VRPCALAAALAIATPVAAVAQQRAAATPQATPSAVTRALEQAATALEAGRRAEAKALLASTATKFTSVRALMQLARIQSGEGDAKGALATLDRARALAPNAEEVLGAIAQVSLAARAPVAAILVLEPLTRLAPEVAQHHYLFGVALMQAGDMPAAVEALRNAERLDPAHSLTLVALGIALNNRKMFGDAKPVLLKVLEREPDNVEAVAALAEAEEGLDELDAADLHAGRALKAAPRHPTANLVAGMVLMKRGRFAEARDALERAAAADPESPKVYYQLSLAYARLGDAQAASRNREIYQQKLRAMETRIEDLRRAGLPSRDGVAR
jgi:tetratricopeptide (TPR) repeat protein